MIALGCGALLIGVESLSSHSQCVRQQADVLIHSTYSLVPDRAGYAADALCRIHGDKVVPEDRPAFATVLPRR